MSNEKFHLADQFVLAPAAKLYLLVFWFDAFRFVSSRFFGFSGFYDGSTTQESTSVH